MIVARHRKPLRLQDSHDRQGIMAHHDQAPRRCAKRAYEGPGGDVKRQHVGKAAASAAAPSVDVVASAADALLGGGSGSGPSVQPCTVAVPMTEYYKTLAKGTYGRVIELVPLSCSPHAVKLMTVKNLHFQGTVPSDAELSECDRDFLQQLNEHKVSLPDPLHFSAVMHEVLVPRSVSHPNIMFPPALDVCPQLLRLKLHGRFQRAEMLVRMWMPLYQEIRIRPHAPVVLSIMGQVFLGLQALHGRSIVHGDMKRQNISVTMQNGEVYVKILDFSLSQRVYGRRLQAAIFNHDAAARQYYLDNPLEWALAIEGQNRMPRVAGLGRRHFNSGYYDCPANLENVPFHSGVDLWAGALTVLACLGDFNDTFAAYRCTKKCSAARVKAFARQLAEQAAIDAESKKDLLSYEDPKLQPQLFWRDLVGMDPRLDAPVAGENVDRKWVLEPLRPDLSPMAFLSRIMDEQAMKTLQQLPPAVPEALCAILQAGDSAMPTVNAFVATYGHLWQPYLPHDLQHLYAGAVATELREAALQRNLLVDYHEPPLQVVIPPRPKLPAAMLQSRPQSKSKATPKRKPIVHDTPSEDGSMFSPLQTPAALTPAQMKRAVSADAAVAGRHLFGQRRSMQRPQRTLPPLDIRCVPRRSMNYKLEYEPQPSPTTSSLTPTPKGLMSHFTLPRIEEIPSASHTLSDGQETKEDVAAVSLSPADASEPRRRLPAIPTPRHFPRVAVLTSTEPEDMLEVIEHVLRALQVMDVSFLELLVKVLGWLQCFRKDLKQLPSEQESALVLLLVEMIVSPQYFAGPRYSVSGMPVYTPKQPFSRMSHAELHRDKSFLLVHLDALQVVPKQRAAAAPRPSDQGPPQSPVTTFGGGNGQEQPATSRALSQLMLEHIRVDDCIPVWDLPMYLEDLIMPPAAATGTQPTPEELNARRSLLLFIAAVALLRSPYALAPMDLWFTLEPLVRTVMALPSGTLTNARGASQACWTRTLPASLQDLIDDVLHIADKWCRDVLMHAPRDCGEREYKLLALAQCLSESTAFPVRLMNTYSETDLPVAGIAQEPSLE